MAKDFLFSLNTCVQKQRKYKNNHLIRRKMICYILRGCVKRERLAPEKEASLNHFDLLCRLLSNSS